MAEYGWAMSSELQLKARCELNEIPEQRLGCVEDVQELIATRPDINFLRTDPAFILRFLRARKFHALDSYKLLARYFEFRQQNNSLFKKFYAAESGIKEALLDGLPGVLANSDHCGRRILVLYSANWDNTRYGLAAIYRAILLTLEKLIDDEVTQINGFVIIVDWSEFTFRQSTWLNPKVLKLMVEGLQGVTYAPKLAPEEVLYLMTEYICLFLNYDFQDCFPARFAAIHFVNQPWYIEAVFKMIGPFLKDKTKEKIQMHGINLTTLHQCMPKDILPAELGGHQPPYNNLYWARQLIGDETFSFGDKHIYWPSSGNFKTRSETFPLDQFSSETKTKENHRGTHLDEEFFLFDAEQQ